MILGIDARYALFEALTLALFALCLRHAWRRNTDLPRGWHVAELLGGLLFGLLLEWVNVEFVTGYRYGRFALMLDSIPIGIGLGWAVIIYSAMLATDRWGLPTISRPFADALLAINIDLGMDAVAFRMGMWTWEFYAPEVRWTADWFGVPYGNFYGWLWVVFLYSTFARLFRRWARRQPLRGRWLTIAAPVVSVALSEVVLYGALQAAMKLARAGLPTILFFAVPMAIALGVVGLTAQRAQMTRPADRVSLAVPLVFHLFFLAMLFTPLPDRPAALLPISVVMLAIGLGVHRGIVRRAGGQQFARGLETGG